MDDNKALVIISSILIVCVTVVSVAVTIAILIGSLDDGPNCSANEVIAWNERSQEHNKCVQLYKDLK